MGIPSPLVLLVFPCLSFPRLLPSPIPHQTRKAMSTSNAFASSSTTPGPKPVHPLQIPEILLGVGAFLPIRDLRSCLRVCVAFHDTLAPLIWSAPRLKDDQGCLIPKETVQAHAHLVQYLLLACEADGRYLKAYAALNFPNLKRLVIAGIPSVGNAPWRSAMDGPLPLFIQRHKETLQALELTNFESTADTSKLWTSLSKVPGLSQLVIEDSTIHGNQSLKAFWDFVAQDSLRGLHLHKVVIRGKVPSSILASKSFKLQDAALVGLDIGDDMLVALMVYLCLSPDLRSLTWETVYQTRDSVLEKVHSIRSLTEILRGSSHRFAGLRMWRLYGPGSPDFILANFLNALSHGLADVQLRRTDFGPLAFRALMDHHALTLTNLDLTQCKDSKCAMIQQALCVCPGLISIKGRGLLAMDVMKTKECPWVCQRLEQWALSIHMDTKDPYDKAAHEEIFGRLSLLTRLTRLDLLGDFEGPGGGTSLLERCPHPTISMQLSLGLGEIRTLRCLEYLMCNGDDERVSIKDISFFYSAFPVAKHIFCSLNSRVMLHPDLPKIANLRKQSHGGSAFAT